MKVFIHHIYEYQKGLRNLILHTAPIDYQEQIKAKLERNKIAYHIEQINSSKINVFFGAPECVAVVKEINKKFLNEYTPEEDFILGTMLGYDRKLQCSRFLKFKKQEQNRLTLVANS
ncbi:DUF2023 family protein [Lentisphaerota bacterium WC36G]|nr:DUF2023 family protein [Lentisphaerae bacterium WC36]